MSRRADNGAARARTRSRRWLAGVAAGVTLAALRPETMSLAQEPPGCPVTEGDPVTQVEAEAPAPCGEPVAPPAEPEAPAPDAPSAPPPAPELPPAPDAPADSPPAPEAPAAESIATGAPPGQEPPPPAPARGPATSAVHVATALAPKASPRRAARTRTRKSSARRWAAGAGPKAVKRDAPVAKAVRTSVADWARLDPLDLPAFPHEVASTFAGPAFLLPVYQAAAAHYTVPWQVLAAINEIETNFGENLNVSSAGAVGWMQFMPSTWERWGVDANGDGHKNPYDPVDAIFAAARYLRAAGSLEDLPRAIFAYNHAGWYVQDVTERAVRLGSIPADVLAALTHRGRREARAIGRATGSRGLLDRRAKIKGIGQVMLMSDRRLRRHVLRSKRVHIYKCGRQDIARKVVDRRVLETLMFLAYRDLEPTVTSLRCGHGYYTASGNVSHHSHGDAVDIAALNGKPILGNQGPGSITDDAIQELLKLGGAMMPDEIISLMKYEGADHTLALADHDDHIHVGFEPRRRIAKAPDADR